MTAPLLIEIGCEELPAGVVADAAQWLWAQLAIALELPAGTGRWLATPRRLIAHFPQVPARLADRHETATGPALAVAKTADGAWSKAAEGFARGQGVDVASLQVIETPKGPYVAAHKFIAGKAVAEVVADAVPKLLRAMPLPKRMRWGAEREPFARPLHWLVALHGDQPIALQFAGVQSGSQVAGHRIYHPQPVAASSDLAIHQANLRQACVIADPAERQAIVERAMQELPAPYFCTVRPDPQTLQTVVYLTEWPAPLLGQFDPSYLQIPPEVIFTTLRENQKLFTLNDAQGRLTHRFLAVANTLSAESRDVVAAGNARVVSARLSDAAFFFDQDTKTRLGDRVAGLDSRIYLQGLGSIGDKVRRIGAMVASLQPKACPDQAETVARAALLCKADLATRMVFEFPELQGTVGGYYARHDGEDAAVAQAISEHYWPRFAGDAVATTAGGQLIALADKADTIAGCFGLGLQPTGAQDPYSLRRAALGILRTLGESGLAVGLGELCDLAVAGLPESARHKGGADLRGQMLGFLRGRLAAQLAAHAAPDAVEAVLAAGFDDVAAVHGRLAALEALRAEPDFAALAAAFKRVANLVKKSADAGDLGGQFDAALCEKDAEIQLHGQAVRLQATSAAALAARDDAAALRCLAQLRPHVDRFFDDVMVMADDMAVRRNRLALLGLVAGLFAPIADFGKLQG